MNRPWSQTRTLPDVALEMLGQMAYITTADLERETGSGGSSCRSAMFRLINTGRVVPAGEVEGRKAYRLPQQSPLDAFLQRPAP